MRKIAEWNPIGVRTKGRPRNRWNDEMMNDLKTLKVENWTERPGVNWCRRPKHTKGCSVSSRRRRRRSIRNVQDFNLICFLCGRGALPPAVRETRDFENIEVMEDEICAYEVLLKR